MRNSNNVWSIFLSTLIIFSFSGCLSVESLLYNDIRFSATNPKKIKVLFSEASLRDNKKTTKFGELSIRYNRGYKREKIYSLLKKSAASFGADFLLVLPITIIKNRWNVGDRRNPRSWKSDMYIQRAIMYRYPR